MRKAYYIGNVSNHIFCNRDKSIKCYNLSYGTVYVPWKFMYGRAGSFEHRLEWINDDWNKGRPLTLQDVFQYIISANIRTKTGKAFLKDCIKWVIKQEENKVIHKENLKL